jgi:CubicO group peptidase (beta-lactamase class C family)
MLAEEGASPMSHDPQTHMRIRFCALLMADLRRAMGAFTLSLLFVCPLSSHLALGGDPFEDFDTYAKDALKDWKVPAMAIAVVKDGRIVFARGYGVRKVGGNDAVDADTVFPIASITKAFNATAMAMLVDEGKVAWMDCVTKHLPDFQLSDPWLAGEVRIADLLSHRTGLADPDHSSGEFDRAELIRRARFLPQIAPFRSGYHYNNLGVIITGQIIEQVAGRSWAEVVRNRIIQPLEMNSTVADVLELQGVKNVATSYVTVNGQLQEDKSWNLPLSDGWRRYREAIRPAGAICSTANDLAKFAILHLSDGEFRSRRLLKADTVREMQALHSSVPLREAPTPNLTYARIAFGGGFGWQIRDYRGRKLVMHGGSTGTVLGLVPEEHLGIIVLANVCCGIQYMVMHDLIDRMLGISRTWQNRDWIKAVVDDYQKQIDAKNDRLNQARSKQRPRFALAKYAGSYESNAYGRLVIEEAGGRLSMRLGPNGRSQLVHWSGECFRATFVLRFAEDWLLSFVAEGDHVARVTITNVFPDQELGTFSRVSL